MARRSGYAYVVAAALIGLAAADRSASGASGPKQWRITWTEAPQTRAVVSWNTDSPGKTHRVHYDTRPRNGRKAAYRHHQPCTRNGAYSGSLHYHHAELTTLTPGTTYYFVMASDNAVSREFHFTTAPAEDVPFKIIFGGDSRSDHSARRKMNRRIAELASADGSILALAHGGDYVASGTKLEQWDAWMTDHELTVTRAGRMIPVIPARGNHERRGPIYDQVFSWPGGGIGRNYFATTLGPEVLLVTLNSETNAGGEQRQFLESALKAAARLRWRVAQYHKPVYPAVKGAGPGLKHWVPLFERYNLALGCEADGHCIKRTVPIREGKADPTGVVYIGEGGLGVPPRRPKRGLWYLESPGMASRGHHVQLLSFSRSGLRIDVIGMDGKVIDSHTIANRRKEAPRRPKRAAASSPKPAPPERGGNERKAAGLFDMARRISAPDVESGAVTRAARRAESMGQRGAAASLYSKIVKDYPDTSSAERARKRLDSLRE